MKKCILCGFEGDTYFCEKCGGRMEKSSDVEETIVENTGGLKDLNYLNVTLVFLAILVAIKLFIHGTFQWQVVVLAVIAKSIEVFISKKRRKSPSNRINNLKMQLICLCISFALLFTIDSYYRQSENPYAEEVKTDIFDYSVAYYKGEYDTIKGVSGTVLINVFEFNNTRFGDYYLVIPFVEGWGRFGGNFRVFKEKGIEYETPIILEDVDSCKLIIKRKGKDDLVYVFPYHTSKYYLDSKPKA